MKRVTFLLISAVFVLTAGFAFAQAPTEAGTIIRNTATGSFVPEGDTVAQTVDSNEVTTEVLPVYNINVEPDGVPGQGDGSQPSDPGSNNGADDPATAGQNDFTTTPGQTESADAGQQVVLDYTIENLSNTESDITVAVLQDTGDDYDLQNVKVYEDTNGDGVFDPAVDQEVTGPITLPATDGNPGTGPDTQDLFVVGTIPVDQNGEDVALVDLIATNETAVADGADTDGQDNSYQVFENNNIATITVNADANIGIAKALTAGPTLNPDGTFAATFTYTVENFGNVELSNIFITDDLAGIFGVGAATVNTVTGGATLVPNAAYDGTTATSIVDAATSTLPVGATDSIDVAVTFNVANLSTQPTAANGYSVSFDNVANVTAETPDGTSVTDDDGSTNGTNPDPDNDGNPDNDASPTPVPFEIKPGIASVKSADITLADGNGPTYRAAYTIFVENIGDVTLNNVTVTEDLIAAFTDLDGANAGTSVAPANITIDTAPSVQYDNTLNPAELDEVVANAAFDGVGNQNLVTPGAGKLEPGERFSVSFVVLVTPRDASGNLLDGQFANQADVTSTGPTGEDVNDASDAGSSYEDIDPDGDGLGNEQQRPYDDNSDGTTDPTEGQVEDDGTLGDGTTGNENDPTPFSLSSEDPSIGVSKEVVGGASGVVDNGDGTFNVPFSFVVENLGNVVLSKVQVADNLATTFPAPVTFEVVAGTLQSPDFAVNPAFDGRSDTNLLAGTDTLLTNAAGTITFTVKITPNGESGPFNNTAVATGESPSGSPIEDDSVDGPNPDPDDDGTPDEQSPTPVVVPSNPQLGIAKSAAASTNVGTTADPLFNVTYTIIIENIGNVVVSNVQATDDIAQTFAGALDATVQGAPTLVSGAPAGTTVTPNSAFNGRTDTNLLTGTDSLAPGAKVTLQFVVQVKPGSNFGPYNNQAFVTGEAPGGDPTDPTDDVTDASNDGNQVDPDGDGLANEHDTPYDANGDGTVDPNEGVVGDTPGDGVGDDTTQDDNTPTPVDFPKVTAVQLLKDAYVYKENPTTCDAASADASANALDAAPVGKTDRSTNAASGDANDLDTYAVPGEYICYTVVATNTGAANITELEIGDAIPAETLFAISPANSMLTDDTSIATPSIECSTDNGATYSDCAVLDTDSSGIVGDGEAPVTNVRIVQNPTLAQNETTTLQFVVYIP